MIQKTDFSRVDQYIWELPHGFRDNMRVPARLFSDEVLLEAVSEDRSAEQLVDTATMPGIVKYAMAMPDFHQGYGFPIGGVAATDVDGGFISPGGVGFDINCGVRLLRTQLAAETIDPFMQDLGSALQSFCPSGVGGKGRIKVTESELEQLLVRGSTWAREKGLAEPNDVAHTEERGCMQGADPQHVSRRAKERALSQVGSLGGGNHFLEIDLVAEVFDPGVASVFGLWRGQVVVQIHCGSRGFGHQVCTDHVKSLQSAVSKFGIEPPNRQLAWAPIQSAEGQAYYGAMACAVNYAFVNRQVLAMGVREAFDHVLSGKVGAYDLAQVYDVAHNIAKIEAHIIDGARKELCVHRKGATRAFGPGHVSVPPGYRNVGQPVLVPGSMGTASYVLVGTEEALDLTFGSSCHGAGRVMSRTQARKAVRGSELQRRLQAQGIVVQAGSMRGLAEEAPSAYKEVSRVVDVVHGAGIARKVARLNPLVVVKG